MLCVPVGLFLRPKTFFTANKFFSSSVDTSFARLMFASALKSDVAFKSDLVYLGILACSLTDMVFRMLFLVDFGVLKLNNDDSLRSFAAKKQL